jgi:hypothetical protein
VQKHQLRQEGGQTLIVVMLALPLLFAVAALVIDGANLFSQRRQVQNAADAASIAAAAYLPADGSTCPSPPLTPTSVSCAAQKYTTDNGVSGSLHKCVDADHSNPTDTNCFAAPYIDKQNVSHADKVEVRLTKDVSGLFARAVRFTGLFKVSARAVAALQPSTNGYAMFARSQSCSTHDFTLDVSGNDITIDGIVGSNGSVQIHGNGDMFGELDWRSAPAPRPNDGCVAPDISGSPAPVFANGQHSYTTAKPYPVTYDRAAIPCNFTGATFDFSSNGTVGSPFVIPSGVYCATTSISVSGNIMTGNITMIAPTIDFQGQAHTFTPYYQDLLVYAYGSSAAGDCDAGVSHACFHYHGNGDTFDHTTFYVPDGNADVTGNGASSIKAFLEADTIFTHGNNWTWTGTGPGGSGPGGVSLEQ